MEVVLGVSRGYTAATVHRDYGRRQRYVDLDKLGMQDVELVPPEATRWQFVSCGLPEGVICRRDGKYWNGKVLVNCYKFVRSCPERYSVLSD